jgi:CRP-like cAMP-binding protein
MEARQLKDKATEAFTKGRFSKAAELYEEYCRADPKDHQSRLRTGDAWVKAGQKDRAISAYQAAAEGFAKEGFLPRAIAASKLILELDPAHRGVQQMLADLYARRGSAPASKARTPMANGLTAVPTPQAAPEPVVAKSRLPDEVRAAIAAIELDDDPPAAPAEPQALEAGGARVDLSAELPAELSLSVDAPGSSAAPGSEEVVHSVSVGLTSEAAGDEPVLLGVPMEESPAAPSRTAPPAAVPPGLTSATPLASRGPAGTAAPRPPHGASVPPPGEGARPAASSLPPGLAPRTSQRMPAYAPSAAAAAPSAPAAPVSQPSAPRAVSGSFAPVAPSTTATAPAAPSAQGMAPAAPSASAMAPAPAAKGPVSGKWKALSSPIDAPAEPGSVPPAQDSAPPPAPSSAPPGLRPRRVEAQPPAGATALPSRELNRELGTALRAAAGPSTFTELEMEADSLLHAVELAAQAGQSQRAAMAVPDGDEEEVFSLTEEVQPERPSLDALPTIPLFSDLPRDAFIELFERCPLRRFNLGERIIEQGSHGDSFYVICEGSVRVFRTDAGQRQDLATLESGAVFGEMALLSGAPRTASVEGAAEDTQLLEISAAVLAGLSRSYPLVAQALKKFCRQRMLTNVMNTSALFRPFNRKDRRTLVERFLARDVERDEVIIRDGGETDGLYVVLSGEVEVRKDGHLLTRLKEGDLFGEISLLQKTPATATVTATRHTTLLRLPRKDFDSLVSSHPQILVLISELSDERLRRTQRVMDAAAVSSSLPTEAVEEIILV